MTFVSIETGQRSLVDPRLSCLFSEEDLAQSEMTMFKDRDLPVSWKKQIDPEVLSKRGRGLDGEKGVEMRKFKII